MVSARFATAFLVGLAALSGAGPATAQEQSVSREVVQALPSPAVTALNHALRRLAINGRNLTALLDAGNAALALGDLDAALGFFGRALAVSPDNPQANLGMATVYMNSERPIEALSYFTKAEQSGTDSDALAVDKGLAYDLLGENDLAQASYKAALARESNAEATRRLALSYAISGNREAFNSTLRPLVLKKDVAAYRARAFGLAILGELTEAKGLVTTVIPRDLASRIIPYLEFMPRLTKAQQAAAANLGIFPKAAEIGRDDPAILAYRAQLRAPARQDAGPAPRAGARAQQSDPNRERHWVQLAAGRNREALRRDWNRFQNRAGDALDGFQPHVVEAGGMHRLLAGPLADEDEARALVEVLSGKRVDSFSISTSPGAKVEPF